MRLLTNEDLPFADSLRKLAGWNQTFADWRRLIAFQPEGCFLADWNGTPAGVITTITYPDELAWIGMALVHPDYRRRGIGRALLEHAITYLQKKKIRCIKLDATPQGQPLYESLGFKPEWTFTRWERSPLSSPATPVASHIREIAPDELVPLIKPLDAAAFGVDRGALLRSLATDSIRRLVSLPEDEPTGYALLRPGARAHYLGPVVAANSRCAPSLLTAAIQNTAPQSIFWDIPDSNSAAQSFAREHHFTPQRTLTRMYLGENSFPGQLRFIYGIASPELG